ncbi:MAG: DUF177 domain-containing protein [Lachnospiraceae bacterium]|nr:DUF177 domain-containing protein [Lachnospiraceae bacterium]
MRISLSEILAVINNGNSVKEISVLPEMEAFEYDGREYGFISKEPVAIKLGKVSSRSLHFNARTHCVLLAECSRCLEPVELPFDINTDCELIVDENGCASTRDDDEKLSYVEGYELDVDGFLKEELMIGFPLQVLCSEECRGLCPKCGANLNRGECGCDRTVSDPRMSIIRDLFPDL